MNIHVMFTESTSQIPVEFRDLQVITNGVPPEEVEKRVTDAEAKGSEAGMQAEYDRFWDAYQQNGNRTSYSIYTGGFAGPVWTDELFKPKYPMDVSDATMMFRLTGITDLTRDDTALDFSDCVSFNYAFAYGGALKKLPVIDMSSATSCTSAFADGGFADLSLIIPESLTLGNMFSGTRALTNLTILGTIGTSVNLQWSPLTPASMKSVIAHLKNYTGTGLEHSQTLTFNENCWAALEADSTAPGGGTWRSYVLSTLCWNC